MEKSSGNDYEVFLSFRGPDTREDITDYLYTTMIDAGIRAYKDDEELCPGEEIGGHLLQAIEQSKISIPIFSKGYADSQWCLRELVKMVESKNTKRQKIMPIFYDVAPSEVKYQTEHYGKAIDSHLNKKRFDDETIYKWKDALREVGALMGWNYQNKRYSGKGEFVKEVVYDVLAELKSAYLEVSDCLVEVDNHVDEIMSMIGSHDNETKIVGIYGMGGAGKTTLAKIVYNQLSDNFVDCCFLCDIRKTEITRLQSQLISTILRKQWPDINNVMEGKKVIKERLRSKRVLLLLDDADDASQLDALVQKSEWFGKGSKIIITTRDQGILKGRPTLVDGTYELTGMDPDHSLQLFSKHAFRRDYPLEQYISHSKRAVNICGGLPLALEVIGSLLSGQSVEEWDATLKELEESPQENVEKTLMISIEALNGVQRKIFLDVACFFIGFDKRVAIHMWESCKFSPVQSLKILQQRTLIKIREDNQLWMHDWLRDIGRNFIQQTSDKKPEKQQWVWTHAQALEVLEKMQIGGDVHGIGSIEAICLKFDELSQYSLIKECVPRLLNLRFLKVECKNFKGNTQSILQTMSSPPILPVLRWLSWNYFHMGFDLTNFSLKKLVILDLSMSKITDEWDGWSHFKLIEDLKVLNLTGCQELRKTPDLSFHENLERLILERCKSLVQIDPSISHLKSLVFLNLKYCSSLQELPDEMGELESLRELLLDLTSIIWIPEWRKMKKLEILSLDGCLSLEKFDFLGTATSPAELSLVGNHLTALPGLVENFNSLIELDLSRSGIRELPDSIGYMKNLKVLKMPESTISKLPSTIGMLEKLEHLDLSGFGIRVSRDSIDYMRDLKVQKICGDSFTMTVGMLAELELLDGGFLPPKLGGKVPGNFGNLPIVNYWTVVSHRFSTLPQLPESLITLSIHTVSMETMPDLSNLLNLRILGWHVEFKDRLNSEAAPSSWGIGRLRMLVALDLYCCDDGTLSPDLVHLSQLKELHLLCPNWRCLPRLPTNLLYLCIHKCHRMKTANGISHLKALSQLDIHNCVQLTEVEGLEGLENLRTLELVRLFSLAKLADWTHLKKLKKIFLSSCIELLEIPDCPESLEILDIRHCIKLQKLPDLSSFKNLKVSIEDYGNRLFNFQSYPSLINHNSTFTPF